MNLGCKSPEFYPKYTHYGSDGQGRDSYILKNNGGLCNEPTRPFFETKMYSKELPSMFYLHRNMKISSKIGVTSTMSFY